MWQPKELLYKVLGDIVYNLAKAFEAQLDAIRQWWGDDLIDTGFLVYINVPSVAAIITWALTKKLQLCDFSTNVPYAESPTLISIACFTLNSSAARAQEISELEYVNMDKHLEQAVQHEAAIGCTITKSYKIYSVHDTMKTLAVFLKFLTNLADWKPGAGEQELEKPEYCNFLENVITKLVSRNGRA